MSASWPMWVALVILVLSHTFMLALGATLYHCLRWINMKPLMQQGVGRKGMNDQQLEAMAARIAKQQVEAERFAWIKRNQEASGPPPEIEDIQEEQKFAGKR